jgi:hypothetical protein
MDDALDIITTLKMLEIISAETSRFGESFGSSIMLFS